jgi:hypothetical protein
VIFGTMMKRLCSGFAALGAIMILALTVPALAETPSKACLGAIETANTRHKPNAVPADCWRMGPLRMGMTFAQARTLLGVPGASRALSVTYRRRKFPVTRLFYIYPRNLKNWLRLAPSRQADFHPVILKLDFSKEALVAISVDNTLRVVQPVCVPTAAGHAFVRQAAAFPYGFHGLTLGAKLAEVETRFGKFAGGNASHDFHDYWPVPLSVDGDALVTGMRIASEPAFAAESGMPDFQLQLDPRSCFVTGYTLAPSALISGH